ncbi:MAG: BCCT family transporter, partial [Lentisphaeria bacterium]
NLKEVLNFNQRKDVKKFMLEIVEPAFLELKEELSEQNINAVINYGIKNKYRKIEICIPHENLKDFSYAIVVKGCDVSDLFSDDDNTPDFSSDKYYNLYTRFSDGRLGYDIQYFTKDEILTDVLKQYERYLSFASDGDNDLFSVDTESYKGISPDILENKS